MAKNIIIVVLIIIVLGLIWKISYKDKSTSTPPMGEGAPCIVKKDGIDVNGTYKNGICIPN